MNHTFQPDSQRAAAEAAAAREAAQADEDDPPPPVYLAVPVYATIDRGVPVCETRMVISTMVTSKCGAGLVLERPE